MVVEIANNLGPWICSLSVLDYTFIYFLKRHEVDDENCKYVLSRSKLTMTLKRACVKDQWSCLLDFNVKGMYNVVCLPKQCRLVLWTKFL